MPVAKKIVTMLLSTQWLSRTGCEQPHHWQQNHCMCLEQKPYEERKRYHNKASTHPYARSGICMWAIRVDKGETALLGQYSGKQEKIQAIDCTRPQLSSGRMSKLTQHRLRGVIMACHGSSAPRWEETVVSEKRPGEMFECWARDCRMRWHLCRNRFI